MWSWMGRLEFDGFGSDPFSSLCVSQKQLLFVSVSLFLEKIGIGVRKLCVSEMRLLLFSSNRQANFLIRWDLLVVVWVDFHRFHS